MIRYNHNAKNTRRSENRRLASLKFDKMNLGLNCSITANHTKRRKDEWARITISHT